MRTTLFIFLLLLAGNANAALYTFDYSKCSFTIPFSGTSISMAAIDMREEIKTGTHKPQYVGMMRGGYGNPWNVDTKSGKAFADEVSACLSASFSSAGFDVTPASVNSSSDLQTALDQLKQSKADRKILLVIHEWKSDMISSFASRWTDVYYDLELIVMNAQNQRLGAARLTGKAETLSKGGNIKKQKAAPPSELVNQMNTLLMQKNIVKCFATGNSVSSLKTNTSTGYEKEPSSKETDGNETQSTTDTPMQSTKVAEELRQYKKLLDEGVITQEDYNTKKKKLLGL